MSFRRMQERASGCELLSMSWHVPSCDGYLRFHPDWIGHLGFRGKRWVRFTWSYADMIQDDCLACWIDGTIDL